MEFNEEINQIETIVIKPGTNLYPKLPKKFTESNTFVSVI